MSFSSSYLEADVLVIGGGLAGAWAAVGAAREGARVILADKGYFGTSGVTAAAGPSHWWVPPAQREEAIDKRAEAGEGLADPRWMARIIDKTWNTLPTLGDYYSFPQNDKGVTIYRSLRGPEYLRAMRKLAEDLGVQILDQSPALELLLHADDSVAGARGVHRQRNESWAVRAGAVVLATGGCAFLSPLLGANNNTGDGYLMAAEAGAELSGMELSAYYTVSPAYSSMTRSMSYAFARYFDASGRELSVPMGPPATAVLARAMLAGPVFCSLDRMPEHVRQQLPQISPNFLLPFVRKGIDPFTQRFEVKLRGEGTVRGVGGLRIADEDCQTTVSGLYAAGDAATRELIAGAISGGGNQNSAWGLSSGLWSGRAAARRARGLGIRADRSVEAIGGAGLRPAHAEDRIDTDEVIRRVQGEMLPYDKNIFRSAPVLLNSLQVLDQLWQAVRDGGRNAATNAVRQREIAALVATGRWCYSAALARQETRGMHRRTDAPQRDERFAHRILTGGLDKVWTRADAQTPQQSHEEIAA
ncbi:FAD-binding protein [Uliginosibacterium sp. H3]|uniref:FAD-binding protein n=1 Tax=Uliginosibacterium silvisoli TaxID=3114758 RepID=A0ABU6K3P5_9RHOO|nr:FAD-binding protein [Uliginosibacterium sp. H3]